MLAGTALVIPMMAPYNHLILIPAAFLIIRDWEQLWKRGRLMRLVCVIAATVVIWPWPAALVLAVGSFVEPQAVLRFWAVPLWTSLAIPLAILPLLFGLLSTHGADDGLQV